MLLSIHVDDGLIASNNNELTKKLFNSLSSSFDIKYGPEDKFIRIEIEVHKEFICIHQHNYVNKILDQYKVINKHSKPISPMPKGYPFKQTDEACEDSKQRSKYQHIRNLKTKRFRRQGFNLNINHSLNQ